MRAMPFAIFFLLLSVSGPCIAQQEPCGLRKMMETTTPIYPPIAKAAHVEGSVIMLVNFKTSGEVQKIDIVSGPKLLQMAATTYVQGWHANEYTGPRTCPIVVNFRILHEGDTTTPAFVRLDLQHVTLNSIPIVLYTTYSYSISANTQQPDPNGY
ncbi:MAG: TonB family protein [Edaphobacter sp.]|nr:TonB family protein [Edaphobacter sp.]